MQKSLVILLGIPGSGKSTFAKQLVHEIGAVRISVDSIRKNMFDDPRNHMTTKDDRHVSNIQKYIAYEVLN